MVRDIISWIIVRQNSYNKKIDIIASKFEQNCFVFIPKDKNFLINLLGNSSAFLSQLIVRFSDFL